MTPIPQHRLAWRLFGAAWLAVCAVAATAAPLSAGQPVPTLSIQDQHEQDWRITPDTRLVIFAAGRKASNLVMAVLAPQPKGFLAGRQAVYLADMSKMPGFITRSFALPSLREQNFPVGVVMDGDLLADWPRREDAVTLLRLDQGRLVGHEFATTEAQVKAALGL